MEMKKTMTDRKSSGRRLHR